MYGGHLSAHLDSLVCACEISNTQRQIAKLQSVYTHTETQEHTNKHTPVRAHTLYHVLTHSYTLTLSDLQVLSRSHTQDFTFKTISDTRAELEMTRNNLEDEQGIQSTLLIECTTLRRQTSCRIPSAGDTTVSNYDDEPFASRFTPGETRAGPDGRGHASLPR